MVTLGTITDCVRCNGRTKSKKRCTRRTCMVEGQCWQHAAATTGLRVKKSTIPGAGKGLFADRDFPANRRIVLYGKKSKYMPGPVDLSRTQDRHPYAMCITDKKCWDARSTQSTQARFANGCDKPGHEKPCNAKMTPAAWLVSKKAIRKGDEIFFPYGPDYWET
jgi:hypothetical protein